LEQELHSGYRHLNVGLALNTSKHKPSEKEEEPGNSLEGPRTAFRAPAPLKVGRDAEYLQARLLPMSEIEITRASILISKR
jgi:hypothetical protein